MPPNLINSRSNKEETNNNNLNKNINNEEKRFASIASTPQSSSSLRIPQKISINRQNNQQIKTAEIINSSEQQQQFLQNSENQRIYQKLNQNNLNKPIESKISLTSNIAIKYKNYSTNTQQNCKIFKFNFNKDI
uniref:Uncharacterized protein n=1 Tax=Meloidogyne hapla TaxID=6305 RepID=A0A1I8AXK0_MELHA